VVTEAVDFARPGSRFTRDFEDLVVWLVTKADKTTVAAFARIAWRTVGAMCQRVAAEKLDPARLTGLVDIGVDEISWRKHHKYLTLVSDHDTSRIVWGTTGRTAAALDRFFDELPDGGAEQIEAVSMDLGPAYAKTVRARAPQAVLCFDPFHVIKLATDALDAVRRQAWQSARRYPDKRIARKFKGARWALLKNPSDLTGKQARNPCWTEEVRRCAVAGLPAQGGPAGGVRRRPDRPGGARAARPVVLPGTAVPDPGIRQDRPHHPQTQGRHHRRR
jgi:transposase